ncbi:chorismate-binding protein [Flavobacteriaceae bacterium XHP0103]|uniref:chorismate-binding protein n=1 Tax=Marixanthotalea marina TaxID=2844359 RepID=UPI002989D145|nr:chorismate-binding protein [Marixanthotalea marina]MBU3821473.1 chorismate-binding protein [Marixanthotalea marina]
MTAEDFFSRIETQYESQLPFVVYRKPNSIKVSALLQNDAELYTAKTFTESGFVFSPFDDSENTILMPFDGAECFEIRYKSKKKDGVKNLKDNVSEADKKNHIALVTKGIQAIKNNQFEKVVLSRKETVKTDAKPVTILKRLLNAYSSAFVYCWYHPKVGLWLGATPETLIKIEGNHFSIMALAGTQNYNGTTEVDWQEKEKREQQIVTNFIVDNLKPLVNDLDVSETETVKAGSLLHLRTMVKAQLKTDETSLKQVIFDLHPTPAVCGLPKQEAKKFILQNEHYNRDFYTGFLGELNFETSIAPRSGRRNIENRAYAFTKKSTQLYVNLRCMQMQGQNAHVFVGGGITETSNPEAEWEETVSKTTIIKSVLQ